MNTGGPAFPVPVSDATDGRTHDGGMTLLDWMAGQETLSDFDHPEENMPVSGAIALAGPQPDRGNGLEPHFIWNAEWRSKMKYMRASAMLAEKARREAVVQQSSTTPDAGKVAELQAANTVLKREVERLRTELYAASDLHAKLTIANRELVEALESFLGSNPTTSLCMHEGEDSFGRVVGTWGAKAEEKARTILSKHKGGA